MSRSEQWGGDEQLENVFKKLLPITQALQLLQVKQTRMLISSARCLTS